MRLLVLPGDGIGPEVTDQAERVLEHLVPQAELVHAQAGHPAREEHGAPLSPRARELVREDRVDGVVFGAAETPPGRASAVITLRELAGARVSVRPAVSVEQGPGEANVTVYRELTEGLYAAEGHREEGQAEVTRRITRPATRAFARIALDRARTDRPVIVAHKANVLSATDSLFLDTVLEEARSRDLDVEDRIVDALAHDLAQDPGRARSILAPNLYGDVLSDLAAGLAGGLGLAPSLTVGEGPPIAEPVHGTAPDIVGTEQANPTAMLASLALLLNELDHEPQARALQTALGDVLERGEPATPDLGGQAVTSEVTDAVLAEIEEVPA